MDSFPYRQIADSLRQAIARGEWQEGDKLPSEHVLSAKYDTTRATVRKAVALLRSEGLVVSQQGKGVFVRTRPTVRLVGTGSNYRERRRSGVTNFNAEVVAAGGAPEQRVLAVERVAADADVAERLEVPEGTRVLARRREFVVDGHAMQLVDGYYPVALVKGTAIEKRAQIRGGVHAVLEGEGGVRLDRFIEELDIRMPTPEEAVALTMPAGVPLAKVTRTAYTDNGQPVEVLVSLVPCDRHRFVYEIPLN